MSSTPRRAAVGLGGVATASALLALVVLGSVQAADQAVKVVDFGFQPASVTVTAGEVVTWQNTGATQHTITADDGSFDSEAIGTGEQFAHLFDAAGTVAYHCSIHPAMTGTVTVLAAPVTPTPSGPPSPTPPPGTLPPNFSRHPGESSAAPTETPTQTPTQTPTAAVVTSPSAGPSPTPAPAPTQTSDSTLSIVGLVVIVLAISAGALWFARRRRLS